MQTWKIVIVGTVVAVAMIVTMVRYRSNAFEGVGGNALTAHAIESRQPVSAVTDPVKPSNDARDGKTSDSEHGWGPFRAVDW
jgi:hypothetical protein